MRIYFLSSRPAALKLNGLFLGTIDGFERHIELDPSDRVFAEIVPDCNMHSVNFFIDGNFLKHPPKGVDIYSADGDAFIYVREYLPKDINLNILFQRRFYGNLITVFSQGGVYLSAEGAEYELSPLPPSFARVRAEEKTVSGHAVLALYGGNNLLIISEYGKKVFLNEVESAEFSDTLKITTPFETCTAAKAECDFSYDGEKFTLVSSRTVETVPPDENILHFAFFESVLTCGDCEKYLYESLKPRACELKSYLGKFVSVTVPPEKFFTLHGNIKAAGLVYPQGENLYEIKYFAVEMASGKITNIFPVE